MAVNRGKQFEQEVRHQLMGIKGVSIDRAYDFTSHQKGIAYGWDFFVYKYPCMLYLECKTVNKGTFPLNRLTPSQIGQLPVKGKLEGVNAGILLWFIENNKTFYVPIDIVMWHLNRGNKSIACADLVSGDIFAIEVEGTQRRGGTYYNYDFEKLLDDLRRYQQGDYRG